MDKDYKLAEHLIKHLQQDDVLAPMVCPTVWDDQDQVDAINRVAIGKPGSVAVTPAGYVPLLDMGVWQPCATFIFVMAASACFVMFFFEKYVANYSSFSDIMCKFALSFKV